MHFIWQYLWTSVAAVNPKCSAPSTDQGGHSPISHIEQLIQKDGRFFSAWPYFILYYYKQLIFLSSFLKKVFGFFLHSFYLHLLWHHKPTACMWHLDNSLPFVDLALGQRRIACLLLPPAEIWVLVSNVGISAIQRRITGWQKIFSALLLLRRKKVQEKYVFKVNLAYLQEQRSIAVGFLFRMP